MKLAIIDSMNQDIGLCILFPEAHYFIKCVDTDRTISYQNYPINPRTDWESITDQTYDTLFIIMALYDAYPGTPFYKQHVADHYQSIQSILYSNTFNKVIFFDNYDYDYDPYTLFNLDKINYIFKRNYNKTKNYDFRVKPFPFIMFGDKSLIEKIDTEIVSKESYISSKQDRIFFTGTLFHHIDNQYGVVRNRRLLYDTLSSYLYNPGSLSYSQFIDIMKNSTFSLDLAGVGDPNKRTIEILCSGSLMIQEKNELVWPFPEQFSEETIFTTSDEFIKKIQRLRNDSNLFQTCLLQQYTIVSTYFNKVFLRNYILSNIEISTNGNISI